MTITATPDLDGEIAVAARHPSGVFVDVFFSGAEYGYCLSRVDLTGGTSWEEVADDVYETVDLALSAAWMSINAIDAVIEASERRCFHTVEMISIVNDRIDREGREHNAWAAFDEDGKLVAVFYDADSAAAWWGRRVEMDAMSHP